MSDISTLSRAIEAHTKSVEEALEAQSLQIGTLRESLLTLEQRTLESGGRRPASGDATLAAEVIQHPNIAGVATKAATRTSIEVKASRLLGLETRNTVVGGDFFNSQAGPIHTGLARRRFIRDFLTVVPVSQGSVPWTRETSFTNAAAIQASEGAAKAESALEFELVDSTIPTIAHTLKASNQALSDQPMLVNILGNRLRYGLSVKMDGLIVSGAATGWTIEGNHTAFTPTEGESGIDSVNRAIAMLETNEASATLILLNPATYRGLQRVKATGGSEEYLFGSPSGQNREALWNVQVLPTNAVAAGKLLVLDAAQQGELYLREDARLDVGYVNDDFARNLLSLRAEMRALNVVAQPGAVVYGDLTA